MAENSGKIEVTNPLPINEILWKMRWTGADRNILMSALPKFVIPDEEYYLVRKLNYLDFLLDLYYNDLDRYEYNM